MTSKNQRILFGGANKGENMGTAAGTYCQTSIILKIVKINVCQRTMWCICVFGHLSKIKGGGRYLRPNN